jgi:hypothetical protein
MSTPADLRLQMISRAIPVLSQIAGLLGFVAAEVIWLAFDRPEPEFMGMCMIVAAGGYIGQGVVALRQEPPSPAPPTPPIHPPVSLQVGLPPGPPASATEET